MRWAYGVTTVPARRSGLLPATLSSLAAAGFGSPRLFVDGSDDVAGYRLEFKLETTVRPEPALHVHGNWVLSLYELYIRDPDAERFAIFQDDVKLSNNLRDYLNRCKYPDGPVNSRVTPGYWNLYTAPSNLQLYKGCKPGWYESNQFGRGALALVFSRQAVITLLASQHLTERPCDPIRGWRCVDGGIVESFRKAGWKEYIHIPGLAIHTGTMSTFNKQKTAVKNNSGGSYSWPAKYQDETSFIDDTSSLLSVV